jgi:geranylgeranyl diphosphate synthase type II
MNRGTYIAVDAEPTEATDLLVYLRECRELVAEEIKRILPDDPRFHDVLYRLMLEYPLREGKGLRPALCVATCRAVGGQLEAVLRTAAVLELYHNAFLIHDDVEDESWFRRGELTLHREHGLAIAVNVGDAMLALTLQPLLDNVPLIGLGLSLRVLMEIAHMTRCSVEGQALELDWVRRGRFDLDDADYVTMVERKTGWYSFISPVVLGATIAGLEQSRIEELAGFARSLAVAFQIQDDLLNLEGDPRQYGKEIGGDLWEGKRTLILLHMMRSASPAQRRRAERILAKARPALAGKVGRATVGNLSRVIDRLCIDGDLTARGRQRLKRALRGSAVAEKTDAEVRYLRQLVDDTGSLDYARRVALGFAEDARRRLADCGWLLTSAHRDVLEATVGFVIERVQ